MEYLKLIKIKRDRFEIRTDQNDDFKQLWTEVYDVFNYLLTIKIGEDTYHLDLGKMVNDIPEISNVNNIQEVINLLTPQMVYSYQTNIFNLNKTIKSFISSDLSGELVVSPYNLTVDEESPTTYDPSFRDLVIRCNDNDLTKVFPIFEGKLHRCIWSNKKIIIPGAVELARTIEDVNFLSLANCNFELKSIEELVNENNIIPEGKIPILVLGGAFYLSSPWVFRFLTLSRSVQINQSFLNAEYSNRGYDSIDSWLKDENSFWILIEANHLYIRELPLIPLVSDGESNVYLYHESKLWYNHIDYICLDWLRHEILPMTMVDDKYRDVANKDDPTERHIYIDHTSNISSSKMLIQLAVC